MFESPGAEMKINHEGLELIKAFEGLMLEAYVDPVGIWTIGYGHIRGVQPGDRITAEEAETLLVNELQEYEHGVERLVRVPLNENEFSALVSFAYNVGVGALGSSTALRRLNAGDRLGAADALTWWNKGRVSGDLVVLPGLTRRRAAEKALFLKPAVGLGPVEPADTVEESGRVTPDGENPDRRERLSESRTIQGAGAAAAAGTAATVGATSQVATEDDETVETPETPETPEAPEPETPESPDASETTPETVAEDPSAVEQVGNFFENNPEIYVALGVVILFAVALIVFARIDDWRNGRR